VALIHGLGTGSDVRPGWLTWLSLACTAVVMVAVGVRLADRGTALRVRAGAAGTLAAGVIALAVWLPSGPLASGWAAKAGTPSSILGAKAAGTAQGQR
jgi:hypothetical protein